MLGATYPTARLSNPSRLKPLTDTMSAAVIESSENVRLDQVAVPKPGPNEVLVQVEGCGVNPQDVSIWEGNSQLAYPLPPGAPGREVWGWVAAVGQSGERIKVGDRVTMLSNRGFAEYDVAAQEDVVRLPIETIDMPFPGLMLSQAMNIFSRSAVTKESTVAVVGVGILGALLADLSASVGATVIALSRHQFTLDIALELGAKHTASLAQKHAETISRVAGMSDNRMCDVVFEAVGRQETLVLATELAAQQGQLVLAGYHRGGWRQVNMEIWHQRNLDILNVHNSEPEALRKGLRLAVDEAGSGRLNPGPVCTHIYALTELGEALQTTRQQPDGFLKAMIMM